MVAVVGPVERHRRALRLFLPISVTRILPLPSVGMFSWFSVLSESEPVVYYVAIWIELNSSACEILPLHFLARTT